MVISPFSFRSGRTCEEIIFQNHYPDNLIARKWTLKPHLPSTTTIEITSKINEKSRIFIQYFSYNIDQISLPYTTKLKFNIFLEKNIILISENNIGIIPRFLGRRFRQYLFENIIIRTYGCILIAISQVSQSLSNSRIKIPIRFLCYFQCE